VPFTQANDEQQALSFEHGERRSPQEQTPAVHNPEQQSLSFVQELRAA
jgi:hypothetical protein